MVGTDGVLGSVLGQMRQMFPVLLVLLFQVGKQVEWQILMNAQKERNRMQMPRTWSYM